MHNLESFALTCGAKIDKPFIYQTYFPLPFEKFIVINTNGKYDSLEYEYWQDVINILSPVLLKDGINILQLGTLAGPSYQRVVDLRGQTTPQQTAYLVNRSLACVASDSLAIHLATNFDKPLVGLFSASLAEVSGPKFGSPEKQILFKGYERLGNSKASFAQQESPKSINTIKPEEIAAAIFKLLGINFVIPFETVHLGNRYGYRMVREIVPDAPMMLENREQPIEIRYDLHHDDKHLVHLLNYFTQCLIVTDVPIDLNLLASFKPHINSLVYKITQNDKPSFVNDVIEKGIRILLTSELPADELAKKKISYYEYGQINILNQVDQVAVDKIKAFGDKLYYRSIKMVASNGKIYPNLAALEKGLHVQNDFEYLRVIDSPSFWKDLDFYTIVRKND